MNKIFQLTMIAILCNIGVAKAQYNSDHLEPVGGIYDIYDFKFEYDSKVRKVLFNGLSDQPEIRFQIMPSFTPESVLDIDLDRKSNKYYIVYHISKQMLWENKNWEKVEVNKFKTEIDKESVDLIKSLFGKAIAQVRYPEKEMMGLDGENYYFTIFKHGLKSGTVWSPKDGTKMGKLVAIGYQLIDLAKSQKEIVKIDGKLQKEIEKLISELKH